MKPRISIIACVLFSLIGIFHGASAQNIDTTPIQKWIAKQQKVNSLSSTFTQTRKLKTLKNPLTSKGNFYYKKPNLFRWENGSPAKTVAVHSGTSLTLADVTKKRAQVVKVDEDGDSRSKFGAFFDLGFPKNWTEFQENFNILQVGKAGALTHAKVTPKSRKISRGVKSMIFVIDSNSKLRGFSMELKDGSSMTTMLQSVKENVAIPASTFTMSLDGYRVLRK